MANNRFERRAVIAALTAAISLAGVTGSSARALYNGYFDAAGSPYDGYYDYAPNAPVNSSEVYRSTTGTPFGPPDPATCGGYTC